MLVRMLCVMRLVSGDRMKCRSENNSLDACMTQSNRDWTLCQKELTSLRICFERDKVSAEKSRSGRKRCFKCVVCAARGKETEIANSFEVFDQKASNLRLTTRKNSPETHHNPDPNRIIIPPQIDSTIFPKDRTFRLFEATIRCTLWISVPSGQVNELGTHKHYECAWGVFEKSILVNLMDISSCTF